MNQNGDPYLFYIPNQKPKKYIFSGFINLDHGLKPKPYQIIKVNKMLLKSEGFKYTISIYLNMIYYHIWAN